MKNINEIKFEYDRDKQYLIDEIQRMTFDMVKIIFEEDSHNLIKNINSCENNKSFLENYIFNRTIGKINKQLESIGVKTIG